MEFALVIVVVILQLRVFAKAYRRTSRYANTFHQIESFPFRKTGQLRDFSIVDNAITYENELEEEYDDDQNIDPLVTTDNKENMDRERETVPKISCTPPSSIIESILNSLNTYFHTNQQTFTDFHIIKDITDRHIQTEEEAISDLIPAPLYLGLAATMFGIIIGLGSMSFNEGSQDISEIIQNINPLISNVQIAMFASVFGLILTTILSISINSGVNKIVEEGKTSFLSFIQSQLLPRLPKDKNTEVSELSFLLRNFSSENKEMIKRLELILNRSENLIVAEDELLSKVRDTDLRRITDTNLRLFDRLAEMMSSFDNFANYYNGLNTSLDKLQTLGITVSKILDKASASEELVLSIKDTVNQSNEVTKFLNSSVSSLEENESALQALLTQNRDKLDDVSKTQVSALKSFISSLDKNFSDSIGKLEEQITNMQQGLIKQLPLFQQSTEKALETWKDTFIDTANRHVTLLNEAYEKAHPKFENLDALEDVKNSLQQLEIHQEQQQKLLSSLPSEIGKQISTSLKPFVSDVNRTPNSSNSIKNDQLEILIESLSNTKDKKSKILEKAAYISLITMSIFTVVAGTLLLYYFYS